MMDVILRQFDYRYLPYELELLKREVSALFPAASIDTVENQLILKGVSPESIPKLDRLTYIASYSSDDKAFTTFQYDLENSSPLKQKRQNTRYATHGLHEYKGKFNPQIVRAIINILGLPENSNIIDPFCGSGTTLIESSLCGMRSTGTDINPLAVLMSNLKLSALTLDCPAAEKALSEASSVLLHCSSNDFIDQEVPRTQYLLKWLPLETFVFLENLLQFCDGIDPLIGLLFKMTASDLIRDYSLQEPMDLRIRRRTSPMPEKSFFDTWSENVTHQIKMISNAQQTYRKTPVTGKAILGDIRTLYSSSDNIEFDAAITSPPYATALPYIDTQRISLVWLGLCNPSEIMELESSLIGSREFYRTDKSALQNELKTNHADLPAPVYSLIERLNTNLSSTDGFRKKAVPLLLYRYFSDMLIMFKNIYDVIKPNGKYALVVGNNKTTIGGQVNIIDTPELLSYVAVQAGWSVDELIPLQTYQRYGINVKNAINHETLIVLRKDA